MKYMHEKKFDPDVFPWSKEAEGTIGLIRKAGRMYDLKRYVEEYGFSSIPTDRDINNVVAHNPDFVLDFCGLDADGRVKNTKRFKVYLRIRGVLEENVDAENPKEAAKKVVDDMMTDGDPLICIDRENIESIKPVSYEEEGKSENDYPKGFKVEVW